MRLLNAVAMYRDIVVGLMETKRTGCRIRGIPDGIGESVMRRQLKFAAARSIYSRHFPHIDRGLVAVMVFFHDIAEYREKDYTPHDRISAEEKHR
jgi:5'-deoxynucleotidase YfbR-like HD superfamily hydrolase